ncbi:MAG: c-type cytochrome [Candidatus Acidiferrales bacterium]
MRGFLFGIIFTLIVVFGGGYYLLKQGYVNFDADHEPSHSELHLAMAAVDASTDRNAPQIKNPLTADETNLSAGARLYVDHCAGCHGVPTNPDSQFARSFNPPVPAFFKEAPDMPENQNFYIIQHGIRWTGMPAWSGTLNDTQTWQLVTFLSNIEKLPPAALKEFEPPASATAAPAPVAAATKR